MMHCSHLSRYNNRAWHSHKERELRARGTGNKGYSAKPSACSHLTSIDGPHVKLADTRQHATYLCVDVHLPSHLPQGSDQVLRGPVHP